MSITADYTCREEVSLYDHHSNINWKIIEIFVWLVDDFYINILIMQT